ncbi:hypothetical protein [Actinocorallia aurea]
MKATITDELKALDSRISIKQTEYFNHSFVPDLVASWPHDPTVSERYVYLRIASRSDYLLEDIGLVADHRPIMFALGGLEPGFGDRSEEINHISAETNTLVADPAGVESLIGDRSSEFLALVSTAVTQGGRGAIDSLTGISASRTLHAGFEGALRINKSATGDAAQLLGSILDDRHAGRVMRLLQAAWVGAGGSMENFPGSRTFSGDISDEALQFLLEYSSIPNLDFWARLGRHVGLGQLCRLSLPEGSSNLDKFMLANISSVWGRSCRVSRDQPRLDDSESGPEYNWAIDRKLLALRGPRFTAFAAETVDEINKNVEADRADGLPINEFMSRASEFAVDEVEVGVNGGTIKYTPTSVVPISEDKTFRGLSRTLGLSAMIKRVGVVIANGRHLSCDLTSSTGTARTNSRLELAHLIRATVLITQDLTGAAQDWLSGVLAAGSIEEPEDRLF